MAYKYLVLDLDNTLYPESSKMLRTIDDQIDHYLQINLNQPLDRVVKLRHEYWKEYGTTLGGMIVKHGTDPEDYISSTYDIDIARYIGRDERLERTLAAIDLPKVVFSNSPLEYVRQVLGVLGIEQVIDQIYDIRFCGYFGKPNPASYRAVVEQLGVAGADCVFVDDVLVNVLGAERVGMTGVWLTKTESPDVRWTISDIYELPALLQQIQQSELSA